MEVPLGVPSEQVVRFQGIMENTEINFNPEKVSSDVNVQTDTVKTLTSAHTM